MNIGLAIFDFGIAVLNLLNGISVYQNKFRWHNWKLMFGLDIAMAIILFAIGILLLVVE